MMVLLWSFFLTVAMLLDSNQAFLTAPVPGYAHGLTTYTSAMKQRTDSGHAPGLTQAPAPEIVDGEDYGLQQSPTVGRRGEDQTVYLLEFETENEEKDENHRNRDGSESQSPLDPWSIVWYIGSFGGLVAFFLIVSCSEWCCRRGARPLSVPYTQRGEVMSPVVQPPGESPPPPYHLFAPPSYDSVNYSEIAGKGVDNEKLNIYIISLPTSPPQGQQPLT